MNKWCKIGGFLFCVGFYLMISIGLKINPNDIMFTNFLVCGGLGVFWVNLK